MFHFPSEISLKHRPPLIEAWLEIRWQLESDSVPDSKLNSPPDSKVDPDFAFALGVFYEKIRNRYRHRESLLPTMVPDEILPYVVRYRFRKQENTWPVLQLGPGIATLNFTSPYTWSDFQDQSLYLRRQLRSAYSENELKIQDIILRYRNAIDYDYFSHDLLDFLSSQLNTAVAPSPYIPGKLAARPWPHEVNLVQTYELVQPKGEGKIRIATGYQNVLNDRENSRSRKPVVVFELEVRSHEEANQYWTSDEVFDQWLNSAHAVIHEWFFALIDGELRQEYERG